MADYTQLLARIAAARKAEPAARLLPRLPPPPPPLPPMRAVAATPEQLRYEELLAKVAALPPAEPGSTRLFRVGETATNYVPPKTVTQWGQTVPWEQWRADLREVQDRGPNPHGAAGRWATDAPEELDFYIKDNDLDTPIYYFDVPDAAQYNVVNTPFARNSRNHAREFVLPDEHLARGRRLMALMPLLAPLGYGERD